MNAKDMLNKMAFWKKTPSSMEPGVETGVYEGATMDNPETLLTVSHAGVTSKFKTNWFSKNKSNQLNPTTSGTAPKTVQTQTTQRGEREMHPLPLIGGLPASKQLAICGSIAAFGVLVGIVTFGVVQKNEDAAIAKRLEARGLRATTESMAKNLLRLNMGNMDAMKTIETSQGAIQKTLGGLGGGRTTHPQATKALEGVSQEWSSMTSGVSEIVAKKKTYLEVASLLGQADASQMKASILIAKVIDEAVGQDQKLQRAANVGPEILKNLSAGIEKMKAADGMGDASALITQEGIKFNQYIVTLKTGDAMRGVPAASGVMREKVDELNGWWVAEFGPLLNQLIATGKEAQALKMMGGVVSSRSDGFVKKLGALVDAYEMERVEAVQWTWLAWIGFGLFAIGAAGAGWAYLTQERSRELESRASLERNQQAILQILEEMDPIQDGDLTKRVSVLDEATATIADSINMTLDALRGLVTRIQTASAKTEEAMVVMTQKSDQAAESSEKESKTVESASDAMTAVKKQLTTLAEQADKATLLAERSSESTESGGAVVRDSLEKVTAIQGKVLETKGKVIRLKEASDQIANILDTIRNIAEQTNVLAINANLEATRAGAAGKGFTVVANSVQGLAKQTADATRQIGALIQAVRGDIESASGSMEETAQAMEKAAQQSAETGVAFKEIQKLSNELSLNIKSMRESVIAQANESSRIQEQMNEASTMARDSAKMSGEAKSVAKGVSETVGALKRSAAQFTV